MYSFQSLNYEFQYSALLWSLTLDGLIIFSENDVTNMTPECWSELVHVVPFEKSFTRPFMS